MSARLPVPPASVKLERAALPASLADLAARINAEHEAVTRYLRHGLESALAAGELLLEAKAQLKHGGWLPWLSAHCEIPERTAQLYMKLARHAVEIRKTADLTINGAVALISDIEDRREAVVRDAAPACEKAVANGGRKKLPVYRPEPKIEPLLDEDITLIGEIMATYELLTPAGRREAARQIAQRHADAHGEVLF
jgi:hypothetical protein